jgi:hypothetical protein
VDAALRDDLDRDADDDRAETLIPTCSASEKAAKALSTRNTACQPTTVSQPSRVGSRLPRWPKEARETTIVAVPVRGPVIPPSPTTT